MDSPVKVRQAYLQGFPIFLPRHPIHPGRRLFLQAMVTVPEPVDAYVVQQS